MNVLDAWLWLFFFLLGNPLFWLLIALNVLGDSNASK